MIQTNLFLFQLVGSLMLMVTPIAMILGFFWLIIKMGKGFVRSIMK